jgi:glycosyltransferase involved in cell wall biosynthesis
MMAVGRAADGECCSGRMVHIVERMAAGGIETFVLDLVASAGFQDIIVSLDGSVDELTLEWPLLEAYRNRLLAFNRKPGLTPALVGRLAARLRKLSPSVVIAHHLGPLVYGGLAARIAGVPCLVHVEHDAWHYGNQRARFLARTIAAITSPHHIAVSQSIAAEMRDVFPHATVSVIPPAINTRRFLPHDMDVARARLGFDSRWKLVGTVGRLVPVKGHAVLVQAMASLPECAHLVIVGDGPEFVPLRTKAAALGLADRLHFLGRRDDVEQVLPAFDVFCLPSLAEGLPRTVLEAQACDVPVVASNVGGLSEAVCARAGALVPPGDPAALAGALQQILDQPPERGTTRRFVEREFPWSRTLVAYENFLGVRPC